MPIVTMDIKNENINEHVTDKEIVGLIPAGGHSTRLSPLPCSKELFPIGWQKDETGKLRPKVASHFLLDKYKAAGIRKTYFILRKGKWDIPQYYGDGSMVNMDFAYLMMNHPHGHPFTLDQAFPFTTNNLVAFGYPDILFEPEDAFSQLIKEQAATGASIVLGIFPIKADQRWNDILAFGDNGKIQTISLSDPTKGTQRIGWAIALWTPKFSLFMHEFLLEVMKKNNFTAPDGKEYVMNHVFQAALDKGLSIESVMFKSGFVHDVGTPEDMIAAQREQNNITE
jgi:glucose-1-phosphate thymidylyltransferase